MNKEEIKLKFKITSYNLLSNNSELPNKINITISKKVKLEDNFLDVIESIANKYKLQDKLNYYLEEIYRTLWSEHFDGIILDEMLKNIDEHNYDALNAKVEYLDKQFNLQNKIIKILILSNEKNYFMKFYFHINRNRKKHIPHVHCWCCGLERKIDLRNLEFIENSFTSKSLSCKALNIVHRYQDEFLGYWKNFIENEEEPIEFKLVI